MFYSHQILTSREHGVATIWLVATLGSKASSKKINKKTILEVDIPGACNVVLQPDIPMALRLQSNLLCGISRVYLQQCGYILLDAQSVQQQMRHILQIVQRDGNDLNRESGRAVRPDQLLLSDDPSFMPDLSLDADVNLLIFGETSAESSQNDTLLSSHSVNSSKTSPSRGPDIQIGSSSEIGGFNLGDFPVTTSDGLRSGLQDTKEDLAIPAEVDRDLLQPTFAFDADGNLIEFDEPITAHDLSDMGAQPPLQMGIDEPHQAHTPTRAQAIPSTPRQARTSSQLMQDDEDPPMPPATPFRLETSIHSAEYAPSGEEITSEATAIATMKRKIVTRKTLSVDKSTEIRKTELNSWNREYLVNMDAARKKRLIIRANMQAKKNAEWWVWGCGIGGLGYAVRGLTGANHPLSDFYGDTLKGLLAGDRKRPSNDPTGDNRRVRQKTNETIQDLDEAGDVIMGGDYEDIELETARGAMVPAIEDGPDLSSSTMPWNLSATARAASGRHAASRSGSHISSFLEHRLQPQPSSRLTSASPLLGRGLPRRSGSRQSSIGPLALGEGAGCSSSVAGDNGGVDLDPSRDNLPPIARSDEFDRFGAAAGVDTQTAAESQWVRQQLNTESKNFLVFAQQAIEEHGRDVLLGDVNADDGTALERRGIAFEELLRPEENTHVVAAQGFHHMLSLASKGLMWAHQNETELGAELLVGLLESGETIDEDAQTS